MFLGNATHPSDNKRLDPVQFVRSKSTYLICFQHDSAGSSFKSCVINVGLHFAPPPLGASRPWLVGLRSKTLAKLRAALLLSECSAGSGCPAKADQGLAYSRGARGAQNSRFEPIISLIALIQAFSALPSKTGPAVSKLPSKPLFYWPSRSFSRLLSRLLMTIEYTDLRGYSPFPVKYARPPGVVPYWCGWGRHFTRSDSWFDSSWAEQDYENPLV